MIEVTVAEAQHRLPDLLGLVGAGEEVEFRAEDGRTYRRAATRPRPPVTGVPKAGQLKVQLVVPQDFDEPLEELRDCDDNLRRAANLHLEPDLNDGVVLNITPLHELVPWKEAGNYREELLEGKYEWSSIGKQLRKRGIVRC